MTTLAFIMPTDRYQNERPALAGLADIETAVRLQDCWWVPGLLVFRCQCSWQTERLVRVSTARWRRKVFTTFYQNLHGFPFTWRRHGEHHGRTLSGRLQYVWRIDRRRLYSPASAHFSVFAIVLTLFSRLSLLKRTRLPVVNDTRRPAS